MFREKNAKEKRALLAGFSERLQFLARFEAHRFAGRDTDFLAGSRVAPDAGLAGAHVKYAEPAQLDSFAFAEGLLHGIEDGLDCLFRLGSAYVSLAYNRIHDIELYHTSLLLPDGKLC
jgi:hypothetical protein